jgi:hypothetical protein
LENSQGSAFHHILHLSKMSHNLITIINQLLSSGVAILAFTIFTSSIGL